MELRARLLQNGVALTKVAISFVEFAPHTQIAIWDEATRDGRLLDAKIEHASVVSTLSRPVVDDGLYAVEFLSIVHDASAWRPEVSMQHIYYSVENGDWVEISADEYDHRTATWISGPEGTTERVGQAVKREGPLDPNAEKNLNPLVFAPTKAPNILFDEKNQP